MYMNDGNILSDGDDFSIRIFCRGNGTLQGYDVFHFHKTSRNHAIF